MIRVTLEGSRQDRRLVFTACLAGSPQASDSQTLPGRTTVSDTRASASCSSTEPGCTTRSGHNFGGDAPESSSLSSEGHGGPGHPAGPARPGCERRRPSVATLTIAAAHRRLSSLQLLNLIRVCDDRPPVDLDADLARGLAVAELGDLTDDQVARIMDWIEVPA